MHFNYRLELAIRAASITRCTAFSAARLADSSVLAEPCESAPEFLRTTITRHIKIVGPVGMCTSRCAFPALADQLEPQELSNHLMFFICQFRKNGLRQALHHLDLVIIVRIPADKIMIHAMNLKNLNDCFRGGGSANKSTSRKRFL